MAEKYTDGTDVIQFPKMVYPEGKPTRANHKEPAEHVLVNSQKELDELIAKDKRYSCYGEAGEEKKKPKDWK